MQISFTVIGLRLS